MHIVAATGLMLLMVVSVLPLVRQIISGDLFVRLGWRCT
jgi:hypothetical protein